MPTTRSSTKQVKLDDFTDEKNNIKPSDKVGSKARKVATTESRLIKTSKASTSNGGFQQTTPRKRSNAEDEDDTETKKSTVTTTAVPPARSKKPKKAPKPTTQNGEQQTLSTDNINTFKQPILINRSPVLQLWAATVSQFLHPDLSWESCLSIGNAISALCAVTKGRAIGVVEPSQDDMEDEHEHDTDSKHKKAHAQQNTREFSVMGFPMHLKNAIAVVGGKSKGLNESTLRHKFNQGHDGGDDAYEQVREAMVAGLDSWKGDEDELDRKAFHMYEKFRPNVQKGQQGWGRKGELNPHEVTNVIKR